MMEHGKKYTEVAKLIEDRAYGPEEAISLAKKTSYVKFDATVEVHMRMGLDPRHADQQVRGVALLPNGLGKTVRVLVFAQGEGAQIATQAGADFVGADELIRQIEGGWIEFDVSIATQDMMGRVGRLGRILGRRGLMPNPRSGTVVPAEDLPRAIRDAKKGRVEFRLDRTAIIHVPVGKVSFEEDKLLENVTTLVDAVVRAKPTGSKGQYVRSIYVTTTMGPGIKLDLSPTLALAGSAS
ncbi:MAG: 50S ribosomal protein L1 [Chloroflexi bacterium]|nr:50S ribosomal protein L1 [Chloroflexota bacterium]